MSTPPGNPRISSTKLNLPHHSESRYFIKQAFRIMMALLSDVLGDLTLSGVGYIVLIGALHITVGLIITLLWPSGIHPLQEGIDIWREYIAILIFYLLWTGRFFLRWRGHFDCAGELPAYILRWLSPFYPKPLETCPCCWIRRHGDSTTGIDSQHQPEGDFRRPNPTELVSCPNSPAPTLHKEEICDIFDDISPHDLSPTISPVSADEITNEWNDLEYFSEKGETEGNAGLDW